MRNALAATLAVLGLAPGAPSRAATPDHLVLVYVADLGGYLEPCGCSDDQRGGLPRAASALARIRAEAKDVLLVGGGDLLFEAPPDGEAQPQDVLRAKAVATALRAMGLAATVGGERDLFLGERFAREVGLPLTGGTVLGGVVGFGPIGAVPDAPVRIAVVHAGGTREAAARIPEARAAGVALLLASHRASLVDDDVDRALLDGAVPVVQVSSRGQSLARIDLWLRGDLSKGFAVLPGPSQRDAELALVVERRAAYVRRVAGARAAGRGELAAALTAKIAELDARAREVARAPLPPPPPDRPSLRVSFVPVTKALPEDPGLRALLAAHYREVARVNLDRARAGVERCPDPASGQPTFVGAGAEQGACRACHPGAQDHWRTTAHARAYDTLVRVERQFDLACIRCHVTGWKEPGGACGITRTAGREGVQCEACHGPGSRHVADPPGHIDRAVAEARCLGCHTPEASTQFESAAYRARVVGPGHGQASK